jgi:hypothetical protein
VINLDELLVVRFNQDTSILDYKNGNRYRVYRSEDASKKSFDAFREFWRSKKQCCNNVEDYIVPGFDVTEGFGEERESVTLDTVVLSGTFVYDNRGLSSRKTFGEITVEFDKVESIKLEAKHVYRFGSAYDKCNKGIEKMLLICLKDDSCYFSCFDGTEAFNYIINKWRRYIDQDE